MKKLIFILFVIGLFSCNNKDYDSLNGKWGFNDIEGSYGEFWIDDNYVLLFDEVGYYPQIHKYQFSNNTITPLNYVVENYKFYVKYLDGSKMVLNDSYKDYELHRISSEVNIDTSKVFEDEVFKEFGLRLKKQN